MTSLTNVAFALSEKFTDLEKKMIVQNSLPAMTTWMAKVRAFHTLYDAPQHHEPTPGLPQMDDNRLQLRLDLIEEEFEELKKAVGDRDIIEIADALGDIAYVVCGFAIEAGIDLETVFQEIHASNLTKLGEDGNPVKREDGKILKGPSFVRPDIGTLLGVTKPQAKESTAKAKSKNA